MRIWLLFLSLTTLAFAAAPSAMPKRLSLRLEQLSEASYRVELIEGASAVRYRHNPATFTTAQGTKEERIEIPPERWPVFWQRLEEAKAWGWKKNYRDKGVDETSLWHVRIEWDGRKLESSGVNAYPELEQFSVYTAAVSELLGGLKFE